MTRNCTHQQRTADAANVEGTQEKTSLDAAAPANPGTTAASPKGAAKSLEP